MSQILVAVRIYQLVAFSSEKTKNSAHFRSDDVGCGRLRSDKLDAVLRGRQRCTGHSTSSNRIVSLLVLVQVLFPLLQLVDDCVRHVATDLRPVGEHHVKLVKRRASRSHENASTHDAGIKIIIMPVCVTSQESCCCCTCQVRHRCSSMACCWALQGPSYSHTPFLLR